jgi:hypothetical protein
LRDQCGWGKLRLAASVHHPRMVVVVKSKETRVTWLHNHITTFSNSMQSYALSRAS